MMTTLAEQVGQCLFSRQYRLVVAESCTGGLLAATITSVPGSSAWFERGFVTYTNQAKSELLGVSEVCLTRYGAVSEETAQAMADGAWQASPADLSIAITGIAGPAGGTEQKPIGTVCFAWAGEGIGLLSEQKKFSGDRQAVREAAVQYALQKVLQLLV